jgi:hypothetical protein
VGSQFPGISPNGISNFSETTHPAYIGGDTQTEKGKLFESLADLTDEDGALAEMEDIEPYIDWMHPQEDEDQKIVPPTGENLLDNESRDMLPPLNSGEEKGLGALAQVKFFTLDDSSWTR